VVLLGEADGAPGAYSQSILDELERRNLFLTPLDLTRSWYRYHQLFRDVLRRRLTYGAAPRLQATLHRRAASWFAAQSSLKLVEPALRHALAAGDDDYAAELLLRHAPALLRQLDLTLLRDWIALLPPSLVRRHARLALIAGWTLTLTGQLGAAITLLDEVTATQAPQASPAVMAEVRLIGAMNARLRGDLLAARTLVAQALPDVGSADRDACTWAAYLRGFTALDDDDQDSARAALEEAVRLGAAAGQLPLALSPHSRLALNALRRGSSRLPGPAVIGLRLWLPAEQLHRRRQGWPMSCAGSLLTDATTWLGPSGPCCRGSSGCGDGLTSTCWCWA
jgi:LuxR family maltose regulon positive regulatory protein